MLVIFFHLSNNLYQKSSVICCEYVKVRKFIISTIQVFCSLNCFKQKVHLAAEVLESER